MTEGPSSPDQPRDIQAFLADNRELATLVGVGLLVILTIATYIPTLSNGFIWDDDYYVTNNHLLTSWEGLQRIWTDVFPDPARYPLPQYYPLTHTSFWVEYHLWHLSPVGYHATNIVLHTLNALLVWLILRKLAVPGAFLAAVIFAVHPINVESISWVAERKNVLSLLLFLTSLYVYLRFAGILPGRTPGRLSVKDNLLKLPDDPQRLYWLAFILFLGALFAKTVTSSMPVVALLLIWWKRRKLTGKEIVPALPLIVVGAGMGALTAYLEKWRVGVAARPDEWIYAPDALGQFAARCMIAGKVIWFYIGKLLVPYPLIFNYPRWQIDPHNLPQYGFLAAAVVMVILLFVLAKKIGYGPLVAVLFYLITLFPAMGFVNVWPMQYSFVADHFVYLPSIGLIALFAAIVWKYLPPEPLAGAMAVVIAVMIGLGVSQQKTYFSNATLWRTTLVKTNQKSWLAANNYGLLLYNENRIPEAQEWFEKVIALKPNHPEARLNLAKIEQRRAQVAGDLRAQATTNPSTQLAALIPTTSPAEYNENAIKLYEDALRVQPNYVDAHFYLARLLLSLNRTDEAVAHLQEAVKLDPHHYDARIALGDLAYKAGKYPEALDQYALAEESEPDLPAAYAKTGTVLLALGRVEDGFQQWDTVLKLAPKDPSWATQFGQDMLTSGEYPKATGYFQFALRIDPRFVPAINGLGVAAIKSGYKFEKQARDNFELALQIDPTFKPARENLDAMASGKLVPATRPTTRAASGPSTSTIEPPPVK